MHMRQRAFLGQSAINICLGILYDTGKLRFLSICVKYGTIQGFTQGLAR